MKSPQPRREPETEGAQGRGTEAAEEGRPDEEMSPRSRTSPISPRRVQGPRPRGPARHDVPAGIPTELTVTGVSTAMNTRRRRSPCTVVAMFLDRAIPQPHVGGPACSPSARSCPSFSPTPPSRRRQGREGEGHRPRRRRTDRRQRRTQHRRPVRRRPLPEGPADARASPRRKCSSSTTTAACTRA